MPKLQLTNILAWTHLAICAFLSFSVTLVMLAYLSSKDKPPVAALIPVMVMAVYGAACLAVASRHMRERSAASAARLAPLSGVTVWLILISFVPADPAMPRAVYAAALVATVAAGVGTHVFLKRRIAAQMNAGA